MREKSRERTIQEFRSVLLDLVNDDHSICEIAARKGIFCRGFGQLSDEELWRRYDWIVERLHPRSREELEELANRWQVSQRLACGTALACDTQAIDRDTCRGWDEFSTERLVELLNETRNRLEKSSKPRQNATPPARSRASRSDLRV